MGPLPYMAMKMAEINGGDPIHPLKRPGMILLGLDESISGNLRKISREEIPRYSEWKEACEVGVWKVWKFPQILTLCMM